MTKPESETDPWAKVRTFDVSTYGPGVLGGGAWSAKAAVYLAKEVDAARAAEAAQHRQEIAAKDATIKRIQNAARVLVDGADRRGEAEVKRRVAAGLPTLDSEREMNAILTDENDALRVRLAAVEAERDKQAEQIADLTMHKASRDSQLGCLLEDIGGKKYPTMNEARDQIAAWKAMTAERDRLKAALERLRDCDWTIGRGDRMDAVRDIARAALTPQGQSTDGETR